MKKTALDASSRRAFLKHTALAGTGFAALGALGWWAVRERGQAAHGDETKVSR
jgi:hypothetical protein